MNPSTAERNLLLGMIALQMELVSQDALIRAFQAWTLAKTRPLEDLLIEQGAIKAEGREFLVAISAKFLALHQEDLEQSLASLSSALSLREKLAEISDSDLEKTLQSLDVKRQATKAHEQSIELNLDPTSLHQPRGNSDRFRILRPHAKGGLGEVSIAEDLELNREVALKQIQNRFDIDRESRERFMSEAEITGQLEHPGIVPVYSLGTTHNGQPFYAMRFIRGESLRQAIDDFHANLKAGIEPTEFRRGLRKLVGRVVDVCNAIEYAHSRGVLHRDLKPGNIMLGKYGETLVVDWGLAKPIGKQEEHRKQNDEPTVVPKSKEGSSETRLGTIVGTLAYMSPEQAEGNHRLLGPRSDVYCLGATLYCVLTGQPPIKRQSELEMLEAVRQGRIRPPDEVQPWVPKPLAAICRKALTLRPEQRYASAANLADELELWLADEPVSAYREPLLERIGRFSRNHQTAVTATLASLTIGLITLFSMFQVVANRNQELQISRDNESKAKTSALEAMQSATVSRDTVIDLAIDTLYAAEDQLRDASKIDTYRTKVMDESYAAFKDLKLDQTDDPELLYDFARVARLSGNQRARSLDYPQGLKRLEESILAQEKYAAKTTLDRKNYLGETYRDLGGWLRLVPRFDDAAKAYDEATKITADLLAQDPANVKYQRSQATLNLYASVLWNEYQEYERSLQGLIQACEFFKEVIEQGTPQRDDPMVACMCYQGKRNNCYCWKGSKR